MTLLHRIAAWLVALFAPCDFTALHRSLTAMSETLETLQQKLSDNTAAITGLQTTVDTVQAAAVVAFADLSAQISDLQAQLGAGTPVSQADLDALGANLDTQAAALAAVTQDVTDTPIPPVSAPTPPTL